VRILAGELYALATGRAKEEDVRAAFETGKRSLLYKTMPARGLTLERVEYEIPVFPLRTETEER